MSEKITLSARDLSAGYGSKIILSGINFDLAEGQIVSLIGPNGSGKSTLLKTLMGDLPLIKGAVLLEGRELGTLSRSEIAKSMADLPGDGSDWPLSFYGAYGKTQGRGYQGCRGGYGTDRDR